MSFIQDVRDGINRHIEKNYPTFNGFCKAQEIGQGKLWKFLKGYVEVGYKTPTGMNSNSLGELLDKFGAKVVFPDDVKDRTKSCIFIKATKAATAVTELAPKQEEFKAIPLVDLPATSFALTVPDSAIRSWVMVHAMHPSVRMRSNVIAVEIGRGQRSMVPTLHPMDTVLVDLEDKNPGDGKGMFLVKAPNGAMDVKRVSIDTRNGKTQLIYYSDNAQEYPPETHVLEDEYKGDIGRAIVGKIIWAWSDMSQK